MTDSSQHGNTGRDARVDETGPAAQRQRRNLAATLQGMEQQLRRHSALEDLGPLFGPPAPGPCPPPGPAGGQ